MGYMKSWNNLYITLCHWDVVNIDIKLICINGLNRKIK